MPLLDAERLPLRRLQRTPAIADSPSNIARLVIDAAVAIQHHPHLILIEHAALYGVVEQGKRHIILFARIKFFDFIDFLQCPIEIHALPP